MTHTEAVVNSLAAGEGVWPHPAFTPSLLQEAGERAFLCIKNYLFVSHAADVLQVTASRALDSLCLRFLLPLGVMRPYMSALGANVKEKFTNVKRNSKVSSK
jgi:hypothetical protein